MLVKSSLSQFGLDIASMKLERWRERTRTTSEIERLKAIKATLVAELKATEKDIREEEHRLFMEKLASCSTQGKRSRWFLVWFGYAMLTVRTRTAMTVEQLKSEMNPKAVKDREYLNGPLAVEAVSKHRYYAALRSH